METGLNNEQTTISLHSKPHSRWIGEQLTILAEAMGEVLTPVRLQLYAADLADLGRSQLAVAFARARRELKFFPKIAELRELAGACVKQSQDAEARKAWDVLQSFVSKYVGNDVHGDFGPEHGWYPKSFPRLSNRILDTVRRTGGWKVYKCATDEDFPFAQKRFFEEFAAWTAVERVDSSHMLTATAPEAKRLPSAPVLAEIKPVHAPIVQPKPFSQPLTETQRRDRYEQLKRQAESLRPGQAQPSHKNAGGSSALQTPAVSS